MAPISHAPTLFVIDPGTCVPELECFNAIARKSPVGTSYHLPALFGLESLADPHQGVCAGIVVLGSRSSVTECSPWQKKLEVWLEKKMQAGVPLLGICYGHQLLAHMFGGRVDFIGHKHKGTREISLQSDLALQREAQTGPLVVSHEEYVVQLPSDLVSWGTSELYQNEALRSKSLSIWGVQAHPEALPCFATRGGFAVSDEGAYTFGYGVVDSFLHYVQRTCA
jgi:GMP synthase-like glutamine amidotransferase